MPIADGPISTFAWFGVDSVNAQVKTAADSGTLSVTKAEHGVEREFDILDIEVEVPNMSKMELAHYNSTVGASTKNLCTAYVDTNSSLMETATPAKSGDIFFSTVTITISYKDDCKGSTINDKDSNAYNGDQVRATIAAKSIDISIAPDTTNNSRARVFAYSSGEGVAAADASNVLVTNNTGTALTALSDKDGKVTITNFCYIYFLGDNAGGVDNSGSWTPESDATLSGDVIVTISQHTGA